MSCWPNVYSLYIGVLGAHRRKGVSTRTKCKSLGWYSNRPVEFVTAVKCIHFTDFEIMIPKMERDEPTMLYKITPINQDGTHALS